LYLFPAHQSNLMMLSSYVLTTEIKSAHLLLNNTISSSYELMYDVAAKNLEQQLLATSKYDSRLSCPGCGGEDFYIYRNNNIAPFDDNSNNKLYEMVVECKNSQCQIVTQTFALKVKYQEDKSQDFKIIGNQIIINVFECSECGDYGEKYRELTRYAHTTCIKYEPPHFVEWQCPKHPSAKTIHIDEYIEDMLPI
jgi:hypothetical protein